MSELINKAKENVPKVYESGRKIGHDEGMNKAVDVQEEFLESQPQTHYDTFWDNYQENGTRTDYQYAFCRKGWNNETFKPKYPIVAKGTAAYIFDACGLTDFDFVEKGIELDTSGASSLTYLFRGAGGIKRVGIINGTGCKDLNRLFYYMTSLEAIDNLVINENVGFDNTFIGSENLVNITISGVIGKNGFSITSKVLSKTSIESIINALSTTTTGLTITLSAEAVANAFTEAEWEALEATKPNWTISLI